jgi:hypothetical protein
MCACVCRHTHRHTHANIISVRPCAPCPRLYVPWVIFCTWIPWGKIWMYTHTHIYIYSLALSLSRSLALFLACAQGYYLHRDPLSIICTIHASSARYPSLFRVVSDQDVCVCVCVCVRACVRACVRVCTHTWCMICTISMPFQGIAPVKISHMTMAAL